MKKEEKQKAIENYNEAFKSQIEEQRANKSEILKQEKLIGESKEQLEAIRKEIGLSNKELQDTMDSLKSLQKEVSKSNNKLDTNSLALKNAKDKLSDEKSEFESYRLSEGKSLEQRLKVVVDKEKNIKNAEDSFKLKMSDLSERERVLQTKLYELEVLREHLDRKAVEVDLCFKVIEKSKLESKTLVEDYNSKFIEIEAKSKELDSKLKMLNESSEKVKQYEQDLNDRELDISLRLKEIKQMEKRNKL